MLYCALRPAASAILKDVAHDDSSDANSNDCEQRFHRFLALSLQSIRRCDLHRLECLVGARQLWRSREETTVCQEAACITLALQIQITIAVTVESALTNCARLRSGLGRA